MDINKGGCQELADIFANKRANGLVDIKFLVENAQTTSLDEVCEELVELYNAVDAKAYKVLRFGDSKKPATP